MTALSLNALAADEASSKSLLVNPSERGSTLVFAGDQGATNIHQTANAILEPKLLEVPGSSTIVATWKETGNAEAPMQEMYAYSIDGANFSRARVADHNVNLRFAVFDPLVSQPVVADVLAAPVQEAAGAKQLYIVQFIAPPLEAMLNELVAMGAAPQAFLPDNGQIVEMTADVREQVAALNTVRWVGPFHLAYKLDEQLIGEALIDVSAIPTRRYSILMFESARGNLQPIADKIAATGGLVEFVLTGENRILATLSGPQLLEAVKSNEVQYIDPWAQAETDLDIARQLGGATPLLSGLGFLGQGVRAEVMDNGLRTTHAAFQSPAPLIHGGSLDMQSHGTNTYGINFGNGAGNAAGTGFLPNREQGIFADYGQLAGFGGAVDRAVHTAELVNPLGPYRAVYQSNSWGSNLTTTYTTVSQVMDNMIYNNDIVILQSQSNANTQSSRQEAWAKNIVSIGGIDHVNTLSRNDDNVSTASFGPAADQRIKPDLAHFYDNVLTTTSTSDTAYTTGFNGTSSATPLTAGHFGLMFQMWHQGVFSGFGGGATVFDSRPHASTAKALMINTAYRYNWLAGGSWAGLNRDRQGWGMADLDRLYNDRNKMLIINETDPVTPGGVNTYTVNVPAGEPELRVTMVYNEPGGALSPNINRINDLSVQVTAPNGVIFYWGNVGLKASNVSASGGVSNTVDTVENVFVTGPAAGAWTVKVFGDIVTTDTHPATAALDADYALVVVGGTVAVIPCPPDVNASGSVDINDLLLVIGAWGPCPAPCPPDIDNSGNVDINDLLAVIGGWGPCP